MRLLRGFYVVATAITKAVVGLVWGLGVAQLVLFVSFLFFLDEFSVIVSFADFLMCLCSPSWKIVLHAYAQGVADMTLGQGEGIFTLIIVMVMR